jgi:hypothetical protein
VTKSREYRVVRARSDWPACPVVYVVPASSLQAARAPEAGDAGGGGGNGSRGLLLKEMEETNRWARLALGLYLGWFVLQFAVNAAAMSWFFTGRRVAADFAIPALLLAVLWNMLGAAATYVAYTALRGSDVRIGQVIERVGPNKGREALGFVPQSPVPRPTLNLLFVVCAAAVLLSLAFWAALLVRVDAVKAPPPPTTQGAAR